MNRTLLLACILCLTIASTSNEHEEEHEGVPTISLMILFLFGGLLYGGVLKEVNKKTGVGVC